MRTALGAAIILKDPEERAEEIGSVKFIVEALAPPLLSSHVLEQVPHITLV